MKKKRSDYNPRYWIGLLLAINFALGYGGGWFLVSRPNELLPLDPMGYAFVLFLLSMPLSILSYYIFAKFSKKAGSKFEKAFNSLKHSIAWVAILIITSFLTQNFGS